MPLVSIFVSSSDTHSERRIDTTLTVEQFKDKFTPVTGIPPQHQVLHLYTSSESPSPLATLSEENRTLESYGVEEWNCIKIENTDPHARPGEFTDLTAVDKFELTPEEYASRTDTVQSHLRVHKLGRFAPVPENLTHAPPPPSSAPANMVPGQRVQVQPGDKRGVIRFVGEAPIGKGGVWIGVELDEPVGKGDGEVEGTRYFACSAKHASFVRADKVEVGDFPERDPFDDEDDEI
ncbi:tubulin-specific chaperone B, partial [Tremellales sp. Uapishka_1]